MLPLALWPGAPLEVRRSLVFGLLLAGGGLGLWLLVLAIPRLQAWLALAPLDWPQLALVLLSTGFGLLLARQLRRRWA